jgi:hypothetical protein
MGIDGGRCGNKRPVSPEATSLGLPKIAGFVRAGTLSLLGIRNT